MELHELLDREGLEPDALLTWAHERAEQLLAELTAAGPDELASLLEPAGQIDLDGVQVRRVVVAQDMLPAEVDTTEVDTTEVEVEVDASITTPISLEEDVARGSSEPDAAELTRGRRRIPSTPQPLSASELPPPPEHPRLADGEPEPMLEHVDTGPIDLATAQAQAMIAANSTRSPLVDVDEPEAQDAERASEPVTTEAAPQVALEAAAAPDESRAAPDVDDEPQAVATEAAVDDEPQAAESEAAESEAAESEATESEASSDEFEIDELVEIDDEELELLVDVDDSGDDAQVPPPPPPRPPPSRPVAAPPPKPIDNEVNMDDLIAGLAESDS